MSRTVEYCCLNCRDHRATRMYDVSHISLPCEACGEFGRFVNGEVLAKFEEFETTPPDELDWERLARAEKFLVAERIVRHGKSLEDFDVETTDEPAEGHTGAEQPADDETASQDTEPT